MCVWVCVWGGGHLASSPNTCLLVLLHSTLMTFTLLSSQEEVAVLKGCFLIQKCFFFVFFFGCCCCCCCFVLQLYLFFYLLKQVSSLLIQKRPKFLRRHVLYVAKATGLIPSTLDQIYTCDIFCAHCSKHTCSVISRTTNRVQQVKAAWQEMKQTFPTYWQTPFRSSWKSKFTTLDLRI